MYGLNHHLSLKTVTWISICKFPLNFQANETQIQLQRAYKWQKIKRIYGLETQKKHVSEFISFWSESWGEKKGTSDELKKNLQRLVYRAYLKTDADFQFKLSGEKKAKTFLEAVVFDIEIESRFEARNSCYWEIQK